MRYLSHLHAGLLIALLNIFLFASIGNPWSITTGESHLVAFVENLFWSSHVAENAYFAKYTPEINWRVVLNFGIIVGAFIGAIYGNDFKIRIPRKKIRFAQVFAGGLLMGFGARLAVGCNIGHIVSGVPQFAVSGLVAALGIALGAYIGTKILMRLI